MTMGRNRFKVAALVALTTASFSDAFVPLHRHHMVNTPLVGKCGYRDVNSITSLNVVPDENEQQGCVDQLAFLKKHKRNALKVAASATVLSSLFSNGKTAQAASAPIAPMKQLSFGDQREEALKKLQKERSQEKMKEAMAHQIKCEEIELEKGVAARKAYEAKYEAAKQKAKELKKVHIQNTKNDLLINQGICPFTDPEGVRKITLLTEEIDLEKVPGSPTFVEMTRKKRDKNGKHATYRQEQRFVIKCIAEDLRARDIDPLQYFESNQDKTQNILDFPPSKAHRMYEQYKQRVEELGTLSGAPKKEPFVAQEVSEDDAADEPVDKAAAKRAAKEAAAKKKAEEKALAAQKKAEEKAKKAAAKAEADAAKEAAKAAKEAAKAEAAAKASAIAIQQQIQTESTDEGVSESPDERIEDETESEVSTEVAVQETTASVVSTKAENKITSKIVPVIAVVGVTGGAGYTFKVMKDRAAEAEEERQRQFKLIMGVDDDEDDDDDDDVDELELDDFPAKTAASKSNDSPKTEKVESPPPVEKAPKIKKKRRGGLGSVFSKNSNSRETDLAVLLAPSAEASSFATLLAKVLSYGAPGRFPVVDAMKSEDLREGFTFDLDLAKELLIKSRADNNLTDEVSAETFASVVNCMLIDIVDLASSSLKEKDDKLTVNALNVVMDYMDHAASLFDAVAEGVTITPVTYGGTLGKKQLEQMFSVYSSAMMTMLGTEGGNAVTQDRVDTLQQVFNINDKRAEGLIQKSMMKNLMKMMKDGPEGGGMEGLSEMLGSMGGGMPGLEGLEGLAGMGGDEELSPEELKQSVSMMKELVDSGSVSKEELAMVRQQFKEVYGTDIKDMIEAADKEGAGDDLGEEGKELLDLFKTILKDD